MDSLMETTAPETWLGYVKASIESESGEFDDAAALYEEYESVLLAGKSFSYRRAPENRADAPKFIVRCGGVDVCTVSLTEKPDSDLGFGRHLWQVGDIAPCEALGNLRSTAVEITALAGEAVYINGIPLTDAQIAETGLALPDMPAIESRFTAAPAPLTAWKKCTVRSPSRTPPARRSRRSGRGRRRRATRFPCRASVFRSPPLGRYGNALRRGSHARRRRKLRPRHIARARELPGDQAFDTVRWSFDGLYYSAGRAGHRRRRHGALPARREKRAAHVLPSEQRLAAKRRGKPCAVLLQPIH